MIGDLWLPITPGMEPALAESAEVGVATRLVSRQIQCVGLRRGAGWLGTWQQARRVAVLVDVLGEVAFQQEHLE